MTSISRVYKFLNNFVFVALFAVSIFAIGGIFSVASAANIDATNQYAQFRDIDIDNNATNDIINFDPVNGGITVSAAGTTGYAWGETVGWINTNPTNGDVTLSCASGVGTFDGYWWGENTGWINLSPVNGGLTLNADGEFDGDIWSENYGWIQFECPGAETCVETTYVCPGGGGNDDGPDSTDDTTPPDDATCSLSADATYIIAGSPVEISWNTNIIDGTYESASISPIGNVDGDDGSITVYPTSTTTFAGSFSGTWVDGTAYCATTVVVAGDEEEEEDDDEYGCTSPYADNYDPDATINDGSCMYPGDEDGEDDTEGCTDVSANNYNPNADIDDGSCIYAPEEPIDGCTDSDALNYNSTANNDDGSCYYAPEDGEDPNDDPTGDGNINRDPFAYIVERRFVVSEDGMQVIITIRRGGRTDEDLSATLRIEDDSAFEGSDYISAQEFTVFWEAGDLTDRVFIINILDDDIIEGREKLNILLLSDARRVLDTGVIIIKDDDRGTPIAAVVIGIAALLAGFSTLPFRIQNILLAIPSYRRRHQPWGAVYDAETKQPLDPAYVQLFDQAGNEVASAITDLDGRYGFLVPPGKYFMKVGKTDYVFPSQKMAGKTNDNLYQDLYFGEPVEVNEEGAVITKNIPMDPLTGSNWNQEAKRKMKVTQFFSRHDGVAHRVIDVLFIVGFGVSIYALAISPVWFNILTVALYFVLSIIMLLGATRRAYGQIKDVAGRAMAGAVVRAFNAHLDKEVSHRTIGDSGLYYMLVQKGDYYVKVEVPMADGQYRHIHTTPNFKVSNGIIRKDLRINNEETV